MDMHCFNCRLLMRGFHSLESPEQAEPALGQVCVCGWCAAVGMFDGERMRRLTPYQQRQVDIQKPPELMEAVRSITERNRDTN